MAGVAGVVGSIRIYNDPVRLLIVGGVATFWAFLLTTLVAVIVVQATPTATRRVIERVWIRLAE